MDLNESRRMIMLNNPHIESASGNILTFNTDLKSKLKSCKVTIQPVQSGSGDPSPTNVRHISGWMGINLNVTGKNIINFPFSDTVYCGELDVLTGILTVTWIGLSASSLVWSSANQTSAFMTTLPSDRNLNSNNIISDRYKTVSVTTTIANMDSYSVKGNVGNAKRLYVRDVRYTTYSDWLTNNGDAFFVYELATPQTYQLTPTEVKTLLGVNNIWADAGSTSVEYWTH